MIAAPDTAAELRAERRFDLAASTLIGAIAVIAAVLAVIQIGTSQAAARADLQAARLAADLSVKISVSGQALGASMLAQQTALVLGFEATGKELAAVQANDPAAEAVGNAEDSAYRRLQAILAETASTSSGPALDSYMVGLISATTADLEQELAEQNRQADTADEQSMRSQWATLGLSLLALGGVLTGLAAVLKEGRPGWAALGTATLMIAGSVATAVVAAL